ncbi:MAG: ComEC/Rec2 family competence protein [Thermomicrobiales bacterium]
MVNPTGLLIGVAFTAGVALGPVGVLIAPALYLLFAAMLGTPATLLPSSWRILAIVILFALLGVTRGLTMDHSDGPGGSLIGSKGGIGQVVGMPRSGSSGERILLDVDRMRLPDGTERDTSQQVLAFLPASSKVNVGDRLSLVWSYETLESLPPGFGMYVRSQEATGVIRVWAVTIESPGNSPLRFFVDARRAVSERLESLIPGDAGVLASGIVTGDDSRFSDDVREAFQNTGTSHITAVSGQNVAILLGLVSVLFRPRLRKRMLLVQLPMVGLVWTYTIFAGFNPPSVRAALFATMIMFAARFGRRPDIATILALATALMVLFDPGYVQSISFWLSVVSSAALVTCIRLEQEKGWKRTLMAIAVPLMAAQLATIPITVHTFGIWSVGSLIANAAAAPLIALAFPLTFALAVVAFALPGLAPVAALAPTALLEIVVGIVKSTSVAFPALNLSAIGYPVIVALLIPCGLGIGLISVDARRWIVRLAILSRRQPLGFAMTIFGMCAGVALIIGMNMVR